MGEKNEGEGQSSESSSPSTDSSSAGPMEAADEGRYAEEIPAKELEESLHQAEVGPLRGNAPCSAC